MANSNITDQSLTSAGTWLAIALTWPVDHNGMDASRKVIAGTFATREEALSAAEAKCDEIGGVGFTTERQPQPLN